MSGITVLQSPQHGKTVMEMINLSLVNQQFIDTKLIVKDGELLTHSLVLSAMSPYLKNLLSQPDCLESIQGPEDFLVIHLPDVPRAEMEFILTLLYCGTANIYKDELTSIISLTSLLKMVSIPVALIEEPWLERTKISATLNNRFNAAVNTIPSPTPSQQKRNESAKDDLNVENRLNNVQSIVPEVADRKESDFHFSETRSSISNMPRSEHEDDEPLYLQPLTDTEDLVEEIKVYVSQDGEVERMEVLGETETRGSEKNEPEQQKEMETVQVSQFTQLNTSSGKKKGNDVGSEELSTPVQKNPTLTNEVEVTDQIIPIKGISGQRIIPELGRSCVLQQEVGRVTLIHSEEGEGLDSLISVAEAFEKSQQPDFNDIASPVIDGTDTERNLVKTCVLCGKALLGRNALGRHMKNAHPAVFGPYDCPWPGCGKSIESGYKIIAHMSGHSSQEKTDESKTTCATCKVSFNSMELLTVHYSKVHNGEKSTSYKATFVCTADDPGCKEIFSSARHYMLHMKNVHGLKPWKCEVCDKRFSDKQNYQNHALTHGAKKNFTCDICTKVFSNPRQLYSHRSLHLGRRFLCHMCNYKARSSANLRGHIKTMHEARSYECNMCTKKFSSASNLKDHMRIHTGETPFTCEICDVHFKRRHHLNGHIESKAHIDLLSKCRKEGTKVPDKLDPNRRLRGKPCIEDGPVTLISQTNFETHISEISSVNPRDRENLKTELPQVVVFENCGELEPYMIQQSEEIVSTNS